MFTINDFIVVKEFKNKEGEMVKSLDFDNAVKYDERIIQKVLEEGAKFYGYQEKVVE